MKKLNIDFAPKTWQRLLYSVQPVHLLLAGIGFALCISGVIRMTELARQRQIRQQAMVPVKPAIPLAVKSPVISDAQAIAVNKAIAQLNLPWRDLLAAIEQATPANVALLELTPDAKKHRLHGIAETTSADLMLNYIRTLKAQAFLGEVVLLKHEVDEQQPNGPMRFEFEAEWLTQ